ncbi:MAG: retropepsin-like aspartic protease [bacterium]
MRSIEIDYSLYKGIKMPIIPVEIEGKDGWKKVWVFVDSGATYSILHKDEAERLGIDWRSENMIMAVVGDGGSIPVYLHTLKLMIDNIQIIAQIGFSDRLGIGFNLLGRKDIFESFKVCFDDKNKVISLFKC